MTSSAFTLFVRDDCELCETLHAALLTQPAIQAGGLAVIDITTEPNLQALYYYRIPVLTYGLREVWAGPYEAEGLRNALAALPECH